MKRRLLKLTFVTLFIITAMALFTTSASADTYGNLAYTVSNGEVRITDCSTSATSVTIPSKINGYPVTSIGDSAFSYCKSLTSITIPDSVTSIGYAAFWHCTSLTSITIPDSVTSIGTYAFPNCTSLTSVSIGNGVTSIGYYAFYNCTSLTSITIPDSVTSIVDYAFAGCTSLTSVSIGNSVTSIGDYAFYNCTSLVYNTYDNGCYIGNSSNPYLVLVMASSENITSCDINENTRFIYSFAFEDCTSLTSVSIGNSVTSIGDFAFEDCTSLASINIPDGVTSIGNCAFYNCTSLTSVTIPDSVTSIGNHAFYYCTSLTGVYITDIAAWCNISFGEDYSNPLYYAKNLYLNGTLITELVIPDGVTSIGSSAFYDCTSLTSVTIPDSVTSIGNYAFNGCTKLSTVYYCGTDEEWSNISIDSGNTYLTGATRYDHTPIITEPTCTENGTKITKCDICGIESTEIIPALGHSGDWVTVVAPTCTKIGFERRTCSLCGVVESNRLAASHSYGDWHIDIEPTCTADGSKSRVCAVCSGTEREIIPALGHDEISHSAKAPTCTESGWDAYVTCSRCGISTYTEIPALGHAYTAWEIFIEPDEYGDGFKSRVCSACGDEEFEMVLYASGDVDGDGSFTNSDITIAIRVMSGWACDGEVMRVDTNYDGKITNRDIIALIRKLAE